MNELVGYLTDKCCSVSGRAAPRNARRSAAAEPLKRRKAARASFVHDLRSPPRKRLLDAAAAADWRSDGRSLRALLLRGPRTRRPAGGLELFGDVALLRSLVVSSETRSSGMGTALVRHAESYALSQGVRTLYLLTTTAEGVLLRVLATCSARAMPRRRRSVHARVRRHLPRELGVHVQTTSEEPEMTEQPFNVLILCTGNSARSILGEALVNHWGRGKFVGYSAGSHPRAKCIPIALELLRHMKLPTEGLRSKSWDEFAAPGAPKLDFVFTVCDNAAGESLSLLARPADDRALGRRRSCGGGRHRHRRSGWRSARRFVSSKTASRSSRPADPHTRPRQVAGAPERDRPSRLDEAG